MAVITTGKVRFSYVYIFEARTQVNDDGTVSAPKFSLQLLIPKTDKATIKKLRDAEKETTAANLSRWGGKVPKNLKSIIHDGDEERDTDENPEYAGMYYMSVTANEQYPPKIVDRNLQAILDRDEVKSGDYGRVSVVPFAYSGRSNGISFGLRNVQKLTDGERLGGGSSAPEDDFSEELDDEDLI